MGCRAAMCGLEPRPGMSSAIGASSISAKMERWPGERFEELVVQALDSVPDGLAGYIENVTVVVQGGPTAGQQFGHRGILLGLYEGVSLTRREQLPFRRSCRIASPSSRSQTPDHAVGGGLRRRIALAAAHEGGHHFGIPDDRLRELSWA